MRILSPLLPATFLILCALGSDAFSQEAASQLTAARAAYDAGQWSSAKKLYAALYKNPQSSHIQKTEAALEWSSILWEQGEYGSAKKRAEQALELAKKERLDGAAGRLLLTIGHIESAQGQFSRARSTLKACVTLANESGDKVFGSLCRMNLSLIARVQGKSGMSDSQLRAAIKTLEQAGTPLATGSALAKTGELFAKNKNYGQAMLFLEKAQRAFEVARSVPAITRNRLRIARVLQDQNQYDRAKPHLEAALPKLKQMNNRPLLVTAYGLQGRDLQRQGLRQEATASYQKSLKLAQGIGSPQLRAQSHLALCEVSFSPTPVTGLEHHCTQASERFAKLRVPDLQARALMILGQYHQAKNQYQTARSTYKKAIAILERQGAKNNASAIATQRANLCQVEHGMSITGTLLTCRTALKELKALPDAETKYLSHISATSYVAGFAAQKESRIKQALKFFTLAHGSSMKLNPPDRERAVDSQLRKGIIYAATIKTDDTALKAFDKGLSLVKGFEGQGQLRARGVQLHEQRLQFLIEAKRWNDAVTSAQATISWANAQKLPALTGWTYNMLAQAHLKQGQRPAAKDALSKGIAALRGIKDQASLRALMQKNLKKLK